jgi:hypothetical protein
MTDAKPPSQFVLGAKASGQQFAALRARWPIAFPPHHRDIRPLALGVPIEIARVMGWTVEYSRGVLAPWKMAAPYCRAVLAYDQRIYLDGSPAEEVDAKAKDQAAQRLAAITVRKKAAPAKPKPAVRHVAQL